MLDLPLVQSAVSANVEKLRRRLESAGISPVLHQIGSRHTATGASGAIRIDDVLGDQGRLTEQLAEIRNAAALGLPVTLMIGGNEDLALDRDEIAELFERLAAEFDAGALERRRVGVATPVSTFSSLDFGHLGYINSIAREALGGGPRFVLLDPDAGTDSEEADRLWQALWSMQGQDLPPAPAIASVVASRCPLLSAEPASCLTPGTGIAAPLGSAWLVLRLDIARFASDSGLIRDRRLSCALDAAIELGDELLDDLEWSQHRQRSDAHMNRRAVVMLDGIGELVARRGEDPTHIDCLRAIDRLVTDVHEGLWQRSHRLAGQRGALPALAEREPEAEWASESHWRAWRRRWQRAFDATMLRQRNLLLMSPYSVFPRAAKAAPAYADLLPVIAHADALAFAARPSISCWNFNDFKSFHQRVLALVERQNAASFVATGV